MCHMWFNGPIEVIPAVDVLGKRGRSSPPGRLRRPWSNGPTTPSRLPVAGRPRERRRVHLVDLDGARAGGVRPELVRGVADVGLPVQASGGIRSARRRPCAARGGRRPCRRGHCSLARPDTVVRARRGARTGARRAGRPGACRGLDGDGRHLVRRRARARRRQARSSSRRSPATERWPARTSIWSGPLSPRARRSWPRAASGHRRTSRHSPPQAPRQRSSAEPSSHSTGRALPQPVVWRRAMASPPARVPGAGRTSVTCGQKVPLSLRRLATGHAPAGGVS